MKWVLALNAVLVGILVLIVGVLGSSRIGGAAPRASALPALTSENQRSPPRMPLKVPPVCDCSVDFKRGEFVMKLTNASDDPFSYVGWTMCFPRFRMQEYIGDCWVGKGSLGCGLETREILTLQPGQTVTFREAISRLQHPVRYYLHITSSGDRASEVFLGEYWP